MSANKEIAELRTYIEGKQLQSCPECSELLLKIKENPNSTISLDISKRCFACVFYLSFILENFNIYGE